MPGQNRRSAIRIFAGPSSVYAMNQALNVEASKSRWVIAAPAALLASMRAVLAPARCSRDSVPHFAAPNPAKAAIT